MSPLSVQTPVKMYLLSLYSVLGTGVEHKTDIFAHEDNRPDEETGKAITNKYINGRRSMKGRKKMLSYEYRDS